MNSKAIFQKNQKAILQVVLFVEGENSQNKISIRGTGFIVAEDGKFITCAHVYNEVPENEREFLGVMIMENITAEGLSNYQFSKASLISKDEENDVALLKIDSETQKKFDVIEKLKSDAVVQEGDEVIFLGFPLAL